MHEELCLRLWNLKVFCINDAQVIFFTGLSGIHETM